MPRALFLPLHIHKQPLIPVLTPTPRHPPGIFDISGVMFGMGRLAKLTQPDETIPGSIWAFLASAIGSVVGGLTGSTPVIVQVETAAGINEGGRTGLTAVTIGVMFLCSVFLAPLFGKVGACVGMRVCVWV